MNRKIIFIIVSIFLSLPLVADDIEIFRCVVDTDTTVIYRGDFVWITRGEFKLTPKASNKFRNLLPTKKTFLMYYCNDDFEWKKVWTIKNDEVISSKYKPECIVYIKGDAKFDENNDVYRFGGRDLLNTAVKFNIPTVNPAIKRVYLAKSLEVNEIKLTNKLISKTIKEQVLSDSTFINNRNENILVLLYPPVADHEINIRLCPISTLSRQLGGRIFYYTEIDKIPILVASTIHPHWYEDLYTSKTISYKEYYMLNMDNWEITHYWETNIKYWRFSYNHKKDEIAPF